MISYLNDVIVFVKATSFEYLTLWKENHETLEWDYSTIQSIEEV